jgi:hypothetical protein
LGAALSGGYDWQSGMQGLDEGNSKWFRSRIGLAMDVGSRQQFWDVGSLTEKLNPLGNTLPFRPALQFALVGMLVGTLGASGNPAAPAGDVLDGFQCVQQQGMALVAIQAACLDDDDRILWGPEGGTHRSPIKL